MSTLEIIRQLEAGNISAVIAALKQEQAEYEAYLEAQELEWEFKRLKAEQAWLAHGAELEEQVPW